MLNRHPALLSARAGRHDLTLRRHGVAIALAAAVAAAAAALVTALALLPPERVLPVTGASLLVAAGAMAVIAWASPPEVPRVIFWDFAGLIALFGLCAALMGEPAQLALIERDGM
jgi:hypothetical protein